MQENKAVSIEVKYWDKLPVPVIYICLQKPFLETKDNLLNYSKESFYKAAKRFNVTVGFMVIVAKYTNHARFKATLVSGLPQRRVSEFG